MNKKTENVTEKIENLNLVALRKYACPKISSQKDWYLKCVDCKGLSGCPAGKRTLELVESQTKPEKAEEKKAKYVVTENYRDAAMKYIKALQTDDPVAYLMEKDHTKKRWYVEQQLRKWCFGHNIMPGTKVSFDDFIFVKQDFSSRTVKSRERFIESLQDVHTGKELIEKVLGNEPDILATTFISRYTDWRNTYPEIYEKHPFIKDAQSVARKGNYKFGGKKVLLMAVYEDAFGALKTEEEDEVSIDDFLNEDAGDISAEPVKEEAPAEEPPKAATDAEPTSVSQQEMMKLEFGKKRLELKKRIAYISEQIEKLVSARSDLIAQVDMLDSTAQLFGFAPTNVINAKL